MRIPLDAEAATAATLADPLRAPRLSPGLGLRRAPYALARARDCSANRVALPTGLRRDQGLQPGFLARRPAAVDGFDEELTGWGPEDKELCARLGFAGVRRQTLLFAASPGTCASPARARAARQPSAGAATRAHVAAARSAGVDQHLAG